MRIVYSSWLIVHGLLLVTCLLLATLLSGLLAAPAAAWTGATNWSSLASLVTATSRHKAVIIGNYLYSVGGKTDSGATARIQYAPITSAVGQVPSLGSWVQYTTNPYQLPAAREAHAVVTYQSYLYTIGGKDSAGNTLNTIVRTQPNANGSLSGVWTSYAIPYYRRWIDAVVYNDFLYIVAGEDNSTMLKTVLYAKFNSDGSVPTCNYSISTCPNGWRISANMPQSLTGVGATVYLAGSNAYLVAVGGSDGTTFQPTVYSTRINADGSLPTTAGSWQTLNSLPAPVDSPPVTYYNGYLYANGGSTGSTGIKDTFTAPIKPDGTIGSWAQFMLPAMSTTREAHDAVLWTNYLIALGGFNSSGNRTTSVETADIESITASCLVTTAAPYYTNQPISWTAFASGAIGTFTYLWSGEEVAGQTRNPAIAFYTTPGNKSASVTVTSLTATKGVTCPTISVADQAPTPPPGAITSCSPQGASPARASYLISTPKITSGKFSSQTGKCVAAIGSAASPLNKAAMPSFKLPSYASLKQLYYTQSKAPKVKVADGATQADLVASPAGKDTLFLVEGDLTITGNPPGTETKVVFVEGKLTINPPSTTTPAYSYSYGSSTTGTVFIVKGDIDITPTTAQINAVLIGGGTICSNRLTGGSCQHLGGTPDKQLKINGTVVALSNDPGKGIKFVRDLYGSGTDNTIAAEMISFEPKYLVILKQILSQPLNIFYEGTTLSSAALSNVCKTPWPTECYIADAQGRPTTKEACDGAAGVRVRVCSATEDGPRTQSCTGTVACPRECTVTASGPPGASSATGATGFQSFSLTYIIDGVTQPSATGTWFPDKSKTKVTANPSFTGLTLTYNQYPPGSYSAGAEVTVTDPNGSATCSTPTGFYIPSNLIRENLASYRRMFITKNVVGSGGNLGGLAGADQTCKNLATDAGLDNGLSQQGTWLAWLSDGGTSAATRLIPSNTSLPYKLLNTSTGITIANSWAALLNASSVNLLAAPQVAQDGTTVNSGNADQVWTNTTAGGGITSTSNHCSGWTSNSSGLNGEYGKDNSTKADWTKSDKLGCNNPYRLYCIEK